MVICADVRWIYRINTYPQTKWHLPWWMVGRLWKTFPFWMDILLRGDVPFYRIYHGRWQKLHPTRFTWDLSGCGRSGRRRCNWRGEIDGCWWWAGPCRMFRWATILDNEDVRCDLFRSYDLEEGLLLKGNHGRKVKRFISKMSDCESCFEKIFVSHPFISNQSSVYGCFQN